MGAKLKKAHKKEKVLLEQAEEEKDHPISGYLEIRDFILKLTGEDLTPNPEISDDKCEQWFLRRKGRRRRIEVNVEWFTGRLRVGG